MSSGTLTYNELSTAPRTNLVDAVPLAWPYTIYLEPTNICNLDCGFCPISLDDYKERAGYKQHMPMDLVRSVIEQIREQGGVKSLKLYFIGEPLLHPEIGEIVRLAKTASERVELTTNGMALTEKVARSLIDNGLDYLRVSIYTETEYGNPKVPQVINRNVARLREMRGSFSLPWIFMKVFTPQELHAVEYMYSGIADEWGVNELHSMGSDFVGLTTLTSTRKACPYPFYNMLIKANGDVVPCCVAWEQSLVFGNAHNDRLIDLWRGDRLAEIQRTHLRGDRRQLAACKNCDTLHSARDTVDGLTVEEFDRRRCG